MRIVQLADQGHDFRFVQLMTDRDRMFGGRRDPIRQRVIEIGVHGRDLEAAIAPGGRGSSADERGFSRPALRGRYGDDAHYEPRFLGC